MSRLLVALLLTACASASNQSQYLTYPVETAREDGDWTLLYRDVPPDINKDGYVVFLVPSEWTPLGLSDYDHLLAEVARDQDTATITFRTFRP